MKSHIISILIVAVSLVNAAQAQVGKICNWDSDKQAAVVLTFDDWSPGHYPIVVPELRSRDMVATFFPMISSISSWNHPWSAVQVTVSYGNEMGNHSSSHPKLNEQSSEVIGEEIRGAKTTLDENLLDQTVISFDYPFGDYNDEVIDSVRSTGHIAGRGVNTPTNYTYNFATKDKDYYELNSYSMGTSTTTQTFSKEVDKVVNGGGLLIYMYHSVDDAAGSHNDNWYAKVYEDSLRKQLDALKLHNDKAWITTMGQAIKYHRQTNCASLTEIEAFNGKSQILELTDTLPNDVYNQPLSIKVKMNGAGFNEVWQGDSRLAIDTIYNDTILFKAIPDAGDIILNIMERDTIMANNDLIEYSGRIDFSDSLAPHFSYSGVSIRAEFYGTSISAILDDDTGDNYYNVLIDGQVHSAIRVTKGKKEYVLAEGLEDTNHEVELFKRTELTFGKTKFYGFTLDEGKALREISNKRDLFIEYVGNSITCGYGNEGTQNDDFLAETENHFMTYAAVNSRNFNARHMAVSRSGIGIYRNYNGPTTGNDDNMTNLYTNTFLYDDNPKYDFAVQPDLICINLGTNDFSTTGADSALYVSNYFRLIDTIQAKYNEPEIICLLGSMMGGSALTKARSYLGFIADSATQKGKGKVSFFEMSEQTGDLGIGVHYHPTVAQHLENAAELSQYIKTLKGWDITPQLLQSKTILSDELVLEFNEELLVDKKDFKGFSVFVDGESKQILSVTANDNNHKELTLKVEEKIQPGAKVILNYNQGDIESVDSVKLESIKNHRVENTLTETAILSGTVNSSGELLKLLFNKTISADSKLNGLSIRNEAGSIAVESFQVSSKTLNVYLKDAVMSSENILVSYTGSEILGTDGIALKGFEDMSVENNSNITDISDIEKRDILKIWPNPNNGVFSYSIKSPLQAKYEIISQDGFVFASGDFTEENGNIRLGTSISEGIYYLRVMNGKSVYLKKFLVMN